MGRRVSALELAAAALSLLVLGHWAIEIHDTPLPASVAERKGTPYVSSQQCKTCHPDHHRSWSETFHRTMTQAASPQSVAWQDGQSLDLTLDGVSIHLRREGQGYQVRLPWLDGKERELPLLYTIGSRRMQQYTVRDGDQIWRLPFFYSIEEKRFRSINEAFFRRQAEGPESFLNGYALWNPNCIFCHNTRPAPGLDPEAKTYDSTVAELGIACEECHGPGDQHARIHQNPLRRLWGRLQDTPDPTITHPGKLDALRSTQVCGQCHGQRLPRPLERIREVLRHGDPYAAGEDLFQYYTPLKLGDELQNYQQFHLRFWKDGSPRLTAYELQGLTASACFQKSGTLSCLGCHKGHGGDPRGLIEPEMRTNAACTGCHQDYLQPARTEAHSHHRPESASCRDCHMPQTVYGVLTLHPTHQIRIPDPQRTVRHGQPEACNLCHLDRSVNWAIRETTRLWGKPSTPGGPAFEAPEFIRGMAAGDVVYRTVLAFHAGQRRLQGFDGVLGAGLQDAYFTVRRMSAGALEAIRGLKLDSEAAWEATLQAEGVVVPQDLLRLRAQAPPEEPFEFGE